MAMAAVALGFASCTPDRDTVYQVPTKFVLNTPAMEDQYIDLAEGNTLELVCSQPDYGYSAVANYSAEISMTQDFASFETLEPTDAHQARMTFKQENVAKAICDLLGIANQDDFNAAYPDGMPYMKVYFRAVCQLEGVESSLIKSNVVSYNNIKAYLAIATPGYIYMIGNVSGEWIGPEEANAEKLKAWRLFEPEDAIGSKVYSGTFDLPAAPMFRFYTQLTGWDADSYGFQEADEPTNFDLVEGSFSSSINGPAWKGSYNFPNFGGGKVTIVVDLSDPDNMTFTMTEGDVKPVVTKYIYLVGGISGWNPPSTEYEEAYKDYRLACTDGSNIYTATFPVEAGYVNFRFALQLDPSGWDNPYQIGAQLEDNDTVFEFVNGNYSGSYVMGKGNWAFNADKAGLLTLIVNTNDNTVNFSFE